jgi:TIR domain
MALIAISYRFEDASAARALYGQLVQLLGEDDVFLSEESLAGGLVWEPAISKVFSQATLVVVVIGKSWARHADGTLRFEPGDYVLKELEEADKGKCRVIVPILLDGVKAGDFTNQSWLPAAVRNVFKFQTTTLGPPPVSQERLCSVCAGIAKKALRAGIGVEASFEGLPVSQIAQALEVANRQFLVWHTWTEYFDPFYRPPLAQFIDRAFNDYGSCRCQILLAHPENSFAKTRAEALEKSSFGDLLKKCMGNLEQIARLIVKEGPIKEVLAVRLYHQVPAMPLYMVDDNAFIGWYPPHERSHSSPYFEVGEGRGRLHRWLERIFEKSWQAAEWRWNFDSQEPELLTPLDGGVGGGMQGM